MAGYPVYSVLIYENGALPASDNLVYTVSAGTVVIVRDIVAWYGGSQYARTNGIQVYAVPAGTYIFSARAPFAIAQKLYHWEGRQVLNPTQGLHVVAFEANWSIRISGYQLTLP